MKTSGNTILITGGSQGIGFATAKLFLEKGNQVIITGRDQDRLDKAVSQLPGVTAIASDVTSKDDVKKLVDTLRKNFPALNILINNAGRAHVFDIRNIDNIFELASDEMNTNYLSVIRLTEKLMPILLEQKESAVVNVTSIVAIAPGLRLPSYSASKAALHSHSELLRLALKDTTVKIFELMPPLVATQFSKEIGGLENGIPAAQVADELLHGIGGDIFEIHVGGTAQVYDLARRSPEAALHAINGISAN